MRITIMHYEIRLSILLIFK